MTKKIVKAPMGFILFSIFLNFHCSTFHTIETLDEEQVCRELIVRCPWLSFCAPQFADFPQDFGKEVNCLSERSDGFDVVFHQDHVAFLATGDGDAILE